MDGILIQIKSETNIYSQEREIIVWDFREMARYQEGRKGTDKRLQDGQRER